TTTGKGSKPSRRTQASWLPPSQGGNDRLQPFLGGQCMAASRGTRCIAGGGPAGMMLGYLLARAGIEVLVLEKHAHFLRDFRGDTIHPSTLEVMYELGVLEEFLKRPHQKSRQARARIAGQDIVLGDMAYLRTQCRFLAMMPQWEFLDFLAEQGHRYPTFH